MISRSIEEAERTMGRFNVLIAGRTGVGKSTLINEVFQGKLAATGQGRPVTRETRERTRKGVPLAIYDTRGLELKEYREIIDELVKFVAARNRDADANRHIHVAWVCVSEAPAVGGIHAGARRGHQGALGSGVQRRGAKAAPGSGERGARARVA